MEPRTISRKGVSTYLEVFILIAVATGGAALVFAATLPYGASLQGPSISVSDASIRQGSNVAVERLVVANTGTVALTTFWVATYGTPTGPTYCLSLLNPSTGSVTYSVCPAGTNPTLVSATVNASPGQSVLVVVTIDSTNVFTIGTAYTVLVGTSSGTQVSQRVVAIPA